MINFGPYDGRDGHENCREMLVDMTRQFELQYARAQALEAALQQLSTFSWDSQTLSAAVELLRAIELKHKRVPTAVKQLIETFFEENFL